MFLGHRVREAGVRGELRGGKGVGDVVISIAS